MKQVQRGFTLIELVMVIVILGVLAAVAIPKFVDLKGDAEIAATQGVAGGLSSATAVNYAARSAKGTGTGVPIAACTDAPNALQNGMPTGYTPSGTAPDCVVTSTSGKTASFTALVIN
jgi:prepilin-type N-terminal cleavage/methylation domain-containing protein